MDPVTAFLLAAARRGFLPPEEFARARALLAATGAPAPAPAPAPAEGVGQPLVAAGLLSAAQLDLVRGDLAATPVTGDPTLAPPSPCAPTAVGASACAEASADRPGDRPAADALAFAATFVPLAGAAPAPVPTPHAPSASDSDLATLRRGQPGTAAPAVAVTSATDATAPPDPSRRPAPPPPQPPPASATRPADGFPYQPRETLGRGGMGHVWAALDPALGREVAIKTILAPGDANIRSRFVEEAQVTGQLEHPNIIPVHELGYHPERGPYLVMKRVRGRSLKAVLADLAAHKTDLRLRKSSRRAGTPPKDGAPTAPTASTAVAAPTVLATPAPAAARATAPAAPQPAPATAPPAADLAAVPADNALPWLLGAFVKVCEAMAYAHSRGIIHRDLKPENIMVGEFGEVLVMDWGLAKAIGGADKQRERLALAAQPAADSGVLRTLDGEVVGTPMYMPPEQARGRIDALDARSDVYSLGAILYEILTLNQPFEGRDVYDLLRRVADGKLAPPRERNAAPWDVPRDLEAAVLHAMARDPAQRYPDARALKTDVEAYLAGRRLSAAEYSAWDLLVKWARRNKAAVATGAALGVLLLLASVYYFVSLNRTLAATVAAKDEEAKQRQRAEGQEAEAHLRTADALLAAGRWQRALAMYQQARDDYLRLQLPTEPIDWGITAAFRFNAPRITEIAGEEHDLASILVTGDGRQILLSGRKRMVLYDAITGCLARTFETTGDVPQAPALSPDGSLCFAGGYAGTATLWDVATGRIRRKLPQHPKGILSAVFTPDGRRLLTGARDGRLRVWDLESGSLVLNLEGDTTGNPDMLGVWGLDVSPDGRLVLTGGPDKILRLWSLDRGELLRELPGHTGYIYCARFTPDGRHAVSTGGDTAILHWDLAEGRLLQRLEMPGTPNGGLAFLPGPRQRLLSVCGDGTVRLWDLADGVQMRTIQQYGRGVIAAGLFPDGRKVAAWDGAGRVRTWDLTQNRDLQLLVAPGEDVTRVVVTADGRRALTAAKMDGTLRLWDLASGREICTFTGHTGQVWGVALSRDGRRAVSTATDGTLRVWDLVTGRAGAVLPQPWATSVAITPDGRRALAGGQNGDLVLWDLEGGRPVRRVEHAHQLWISDVVFSDDRHAFSGGQDCLVKGWDLETGREVWAEKREAAVRGLSLSSDGRTLVTTAMGPVVRIWDAATGKPLQQLEGHTGEVVCAAFTPDGRQVVSSGRDFTLRLWSVADGKEVCQLPLPAEAGVFAPVPDGLRLLMAYGSGRLSLWDLGAPGRYRTLEPAVESARARLQEHPSDAGALRTLGEWYAFRGVWDWAGELLERARAAGAAVDPGVLGAGYWRSDRYDQARREYRLALAGAGGDAALSDHLRMCLAGVERAVAVARVRAGLLKGAVPIALGRYTGRLDEGSASERGRRLQLYAFAACPGERVNIRLMSRELRPALVVFPPQGADTAAVARDSDPTVAQFGLEVAEDGLAVIECTTLARGKGGTYVLELTRAR